MKINETVFALVTSKANSNSVKCSYPIGEDITATGKVKVVYFSFNVAGQHRTMSTVIAQLKGQLKAETFNITLPKVTDDATFVLQVKSEYSGATLAELCEELIALTAD